MKKVIYNTQKQYEMMEDIVDKCLPNKSRKNTKPLNRAFKKCDCDEKYEDCFPYDGDCPFKFLKNQFNSQNNIFTDTSVQYLIFLLFTYQPNDKNFNNRIQNVMKILEEKGIDTSDFIEEHMPKCKVLNCLCEMNVKQCEDEKCKYCIVKQLYDKLTSIKCQKDKNNSSFQEIKKLKEEIKNYIIKNHVMATLDCMDRDYNESESNLMQKDFEEYARQLYTYAHKHNNPVVIYKEVADVKAQYGEAIYDKEDQNYQLLSYASKLLEICNSEDGNLCANIETERIISYMNLVYYCGSSKEKAYDDIIISRAEEILKQSVHHINQLSLYVELWNLLMHIDPTKYKEKLLEYSQKIKNIINNRNEIEVQMRLKQINEEPSKLVFTCAKYFLYNIAIGYSNRRLYPFNSYFVKELIENEKDIEEYLKEICCESDENSIKMRDVQLGCIAYVYTEVLKLCRKVNKEGLPDDDLRSLFDKILYSPSRIIQLLDKEQESYQRFFCDTDLNVYYWEYCLINRLNNSSTEKGQ